MPSASSVVDHFEAAALKDEFDAAVEHLTQLTMASTTLDGPELTEAVERRLFSLHARVTRGVPPAEPPAKADEAEQWAAWDETRAMSAEAAQQEYIDLVRRHTAGFDALDELDGDGGGDGEGGGGGADELPDGLEAQLEAAGYRMGGPRRRQARRAGECLEAARAGAGLAGFPAEDAVDADGLSPLHHAVDAEQGDAVKLLLAAGASANALDAQRSTPLHYAALLGEGALAAMLLEAGGDAAACDEDGRSPPSSPPPRATPSSPANSPCRARERVWCIFSVRMVALR